MSQAATHVCFVTMWIVASAAILMVLVVPGILTSKNNDIALVPAICLSVGFNSLWLRICLIVCLPIMYYRINQTWYLT